MAKELNYENMDRPYDSSLMRKSGGDLPMDGISGSVNNGAVEEAVVKSEGGIDDVWVRNYIRSINWRPRISGFNIDGRTGDAQFSNIFLNQFSMLTRVGLDADNRVLSIMAKAATISTGKNYIFIGKDGREADGDPLFTNLVNITITENISLADRDAQNGIFSVTVGRYGTVDPTPSIVAGVSRNMGSLVLTESEYAAGFDLTDLSVTTAENQSSASVAILANGRYGRVRLGFWIAGGGKAGTSMDGLNAEDGATNSFGCIDIRRRQDASTSEIVNGLITISAPIILDKRTTAVRDTFLLTPTDTSNTGFKFPTDNGTTTNDWTSPTSAYAADDVFATVATDGTYNKQSYETFTPGVPATATITGIDVRVKGKVDAGTRMFFVNLLRSSTQVYQYAAATFTSTSTEYTFGGSTDTADGGWTAANLIDGTFAIEIMTDNIGAGTTYSVDYVKVKVHYSDPGGVGTIFYNTTLNKMQVKTASGWETVTSA